MYLFALNPTGSYILWANFQFFVNYNIRLEPTEVGMMLWLSFLYHFCNRYSYARDKTDKSAQWLNALFIERSDIYVNIKSNQACIHAKTAYVFTPEFGNLIGTYFRSNYIWRRGQGENFKENTAKDHP